MHVNELINDIKYVLYPSVCFNEWYFFNVANKMKCYSPVTFIFLNLRDIFFLLSPQLRLTLLTSFSLKQSLLDVLIFLVG